MTHEFFQLLQKDHQEIMNIFEQIEQVPISSVRTREDMFKQLNRVLIPHMKGEERAFYPELAEKQESHIDALKAMQEHHVTELVFNELDRMPKQEDEWGPKLSVLKEIVQHHINEEESKIFKIAGELLNTDQLQNISRRFQDEKEQIKSSIS